jgi:shikimate dehydrogenase
LDDGRLAGHNTDGPGLVTDLTVNLGWLVTGKRVLILGAGGAVQGIVASLLSEQPECIDITNRTHQKAVDIAARVNDSRLQARHLQAKQKPHLNRSYDLVISGTSAGLDAGSDVIRLPSEIIGESTCCYDMIYANKLTPFLVWCQNCGCKELSDGLGMLVEQAGLAFQTWFNQSVETSDVIRQLRREL